MKRFLPLLLLAPCVALADVDSLLPSDLGLGVKVRQSPFVGGDSETSVTFTGTDRDGFDISGPAWSFSKSDTQRLYLGAGLDEWDHERGDSEQLRDMHELDRAINLRVGAAWKLASGVVNAEVGQDVAAHKGAQAKARYTLNSLSEQVSLRPYVEGQWLSSDLTDYYVGVDADEAKAGRPAYQADDGLALKAGIRLEKPLTGKWALVGEVDATRYDAAITDSPIVEKGTLWGGKLGLSYQWR
ncbi:MAG: MipA/OmpV family protein [Gammaproteobacteria bacterium]|nr:MipA/OmpV family protein [Gammaproteobacteria bacterium]MBU1725737.1 MipA/OmpV family protein [Gammaproteobacteria bacterium]MBU2003911.1 MipA/OmpV family protein [Gammaproteobacteria bacterium]